MIRAARIAAIALLTSGLVILLDAGLTIAWKEPISSIIAQVNQDRASEQFEDLRRQFAERISQLPPKGNPRAQARALARIFRADMPPAGHAIGQILIPAIDADYKVVEGTDTESLKKGPGHYPETKIPGLGGTTAIAGHRTTYLAPFHDIDKLKKGDEIVLEMPYANFRYAVEKTRIVTPDKVGVVRDIGRERLVLSACHPLYSAAQRYIIFGRLVQVGMFGPLTKRWQDP